MQPWKWILSIVIPGAGGNSSPPSSVDGTKLRNLISVFIGEAAFKEGDDEICEEGRVCVGTVRKTFRDICRFSNNLAVQLMKKLTFFFLARP